MKYSVNVNIVLQRSFMLFGSLLLLCFNLYSQGANEAKGSTIDSSVVDVSQSSCSQKIKEAQKAYDQGLLNNIPDILIPCINNGFTKIEKLQGYRLLILTYIFLDDAEKASNYMNELLTYEPDYKPNRTLDPIEYVTLYNSFRVNPVVSFGVMLGANLTSARLVNNFGVGNVSTYPTEYKSVINPQGAISIDILLYRKLFLTTDFFLTLKGFQSTSQIISSSTLTVAESQTNIDVPITFKYLFNKGKLRFFARAGVAIHYGLSSSAQMIRLNTETNQNDYTGQNVDLSSQRNKLNTSAVAGVGVNYKIGYGYIILDLRYYYGLSNIVKASQRYNNDISDSKNNFVSQISNYGYVDNDLAINNLQFSVGYLHSLYKIKKNKVKITD